MKSQLWILQKKDLQISLHAFVSMLNHGRSVFYVNYVAFNNENNLLLVTLNPLSTKQRNIVLRST